VKPVKGRKKRHRDRKPAAGRRGEPNELTRGDCGSEKKLAAACKKITRRATVAWHIRNVLRKIVTQGNCEPRSTLTTAGIMMTRHAGVAWRRENYVRKDWTTDKVKREARRAWMLRRRLRSRQESGKQLRDLGGRRPLHRRKRKPTKNGIEGCNAGQRSHLGSEGTLNKKLYEIFRGRMAKQIVGTPSGLRKIIKWTLWRGRPPPKRKKKLQIQEEPDNVGSPATP
jgi:hypothetical protein